MSLITDKICDGLNGLQASGTTGVGTLILKILDIQHVQGDICDLNVAPKEHSLFN